MIELPMSCPICGAKNDGGWAYLCPKCWSDFYEWFRKKQADPNIIVTYLPEYMLQYKMKVLFT